MFRPVNHNVNVFTFSSVLFSLIVGQKHVYVAAAPGELRLTRNLGSGLALISSGGIQKRYGFSDFKNDNIDQQASGSGFYTLTAVPYTGEDNHHLNYGEENKKGAAYYREGVGGNRGEIGFYGAKDHRGASGRVATNAYSGNQNKAKGDAIQSGYYRDDHGAHKGFDTGHSLYGGEQYNKDGEAEAVYGVKGGHKKGHHSSGFRNSYYKDESGNNSRFYDDENDEGDHYAYDSRGGAYHNKGGNKYHDGYHNGLYNKDNRGQQGRFGAVIGYDNAQRHDDHHARDKFYDNLDYGQVKGGENVGENIEGKRKQEVGGVSYHKTKSRIPYGYHGRQGYWHPAVVGAHVSPSDHYDYYEGRDYYPIGSYATEYFEPLGAYYKDEYENSPLDAIHSSKIKGRGYAYYVDSPLSNHYYGK